jgi:hypothetical protein
MKKARTNLKEARRNKDDTLPFYDDVVHFSDHLKSTIRLNNEVTYCVCALYSFSVTPCSNYLNHLKSGGLSLIKQWSSYSSCQNTHFKEGEDRAG